MRFGIDLGNVLTERRSDGLPVFADDDYPLQPLPQAFDAVRTIAATLGPGNVFLVSRCSPEAEELGRSWLDRHAFAEMTGIPRKQLLFCRERREKAVIARDLGLTHFVDDRWTVLEHLVGLPEIARLYLFRPPPDELARFAAASPGTATVVSSWAEVLRELPAVSG